MNAHRRKKMEKMLAAVEAEKKVELPKEELIVVTKEEQKVSVAEVLVEQKPAEVVIEPSLESQEGEKTFASKKKKK